MADARRERGVAAVVGSVVLAFVGPAEVGPWWLRFAVLAIGLAALWLLGTSRWVDCVIGAATKWALRRFTKLDVRDYAGVLHIGPDYVVTELDVGKATG